MRRFIFTLFFTLAIAPGVFTQADFQEYDSINSTHVGEIFYWPQSGMYLAVMRHAFYEGPSMGPPGGNDKIKMTEYVVELNRKTGTVTRSSKTAAWARRHLSKSELSEAAFIRTDYKSGTSVIWNIGPFQVTATTAKNMPLAERFYDGFQGDIVYVHGDWVTFGDAGFMDHSQFAPAVFRPEPDMNYWDLNKRGYLAYQAKDYAGAAELFRKSLAINPDYQHANYNLACMYALLKRPFANGRPYLDKLLQDPRVKAYYRDKIPKDPDLAFWRETNEIREWLKAYQ